MEATIPRNIGHFVNGRSIPGSGSRYGNVYNPATGEVTSRVAFAGKDEVEQAVSAAAAAFPAWAATPPLRRARILFRFKELLERHKEEISALITADAPGDWAFHCHLLYHMHAGMMQVVTVRPLA